MSETLMQIGSISFSTGVRRAGEQQAEPAGLADPSWGDRAVKQRLA
jgi:hypothetical protein